ncbi:hypothetical protein IAR55_001771 [Kwoniella newhampshirensis]|uniref:Wings apart-like protein C-terminal domain-containing protein n=1 Tax=Kwoniella newhampshirensis TaxID=1651941 RepID=A0AAW0Z366_9TREE
MISSSPIESPPNSVHRSSSIPARSAKRTYSRRVSAHQEKRKAEIEAAKRDSDDSTGDEVEALTAPISDGSTNARVLALSARDGSPTSRRRKQTRRGHSEEKPKDDEIMLEQTSPSQSQLRRAGARRTRSSSSLMSSPPPSRSPSPSPPPTKKAKVNLSNTPPLHQLVRPRLQSRVVPKRQNTAPNVTIDPPASSPARAIDSSAPSTPPRHTRTLSGPSTPRSSPKDLSALFAAVSPRKDSPNSPASQREDYFGTIAQRSSLGRPGGRRMLTKTQSMGAAPVTPSKTEKQSEGLGDGDGSPFGWNVSPADPSTPSRSIRMTQSMPESPTKSSPRAGESTSTALLIPAPAASGQTSSGGRAKRTYGRTRTILAEAPQGGTDPVRRDIDENDHASNSPPQASYAELREKFEVDNTIEPSGSGSGNLMSEFLLAKAPQTVSDMRSRGEHRRFTDELGYLVDGIADPTTGVSFKRSSILDILNNMQDGSWLIKMKICGQVERVWDRLHAARGEEGDEPGKDSLARFVSDEMSKWSARQVYQGKGDRCCAKATENRSDNSATPVIIRSACTGLPMLRELTTSWASKSTTRRQAATIVAAACQGELWSIVEPYIVEGNILLKMTRTLASEVKLFSDRFDLYEKGLDLLHSEEQPDFGYIAQILLVISKIINNSLDQREVLLQQYREVIESLVDVAIGASEQIFTSDSQDSNGAIRCSAHAIQLLANLSNVSSDSAKVVGQANGAPTCFARLMLQRSKIVSTDLQDAQDEPEESMQTEIDPDERDGPLHDIDMNKQMMSENEFLCVILALLTTSALSGKESSQSISATRIGANCVGKRACLRRCQCRDAVTLREHLANLYAKYVVDDEDPMSSVLTGYLALLLSKLLAATPTLNEDVLRPLPGFTQKDKLDGLLSSLRELNNLQSIMQKSIKNLLPKGVSTDDVGTMEVAMVEEEADAVDEAIREMEVLLGSNLSS